jgi:hypothetical protein
MSPNHQLRGGHAIHNICRCRHDVHRRVRRLEQVDWDAGEHTVQRENDDAQKRFRMCRRERQTERFPMYSRARRAWECDERDRLADARGCIVLINTPTSGGRCRFSDGGAAVIAARGKLTRLADVGLLVKSRQTADSIPAVQSLPSQRAHGRFVILNVAIHNYGHSPLDWGNSLDGRTLLLIGKDSFSHVGDAEALLPGTLASVGTPIQPGFTENRYLVYDVDKRDLVSDPMTLIFIDTKSLNQGEDPSTATIVGLARVPR